jgi:hypothetical protein
MTMSVIADATIAAVDCSVMSVGASSSSVRARIRATSIATLPLPITDRAARSRGRTRGAGGRGAVVPGDELCRRPPTLEVSSPGMPRRRSVCAPTV